MFSRDFESYEESCGAGCSLGNERNPREIADTMDLGEDIFNRNATRKNSPAPWKVSTCYRSCRRVDSFSRTSDFADWLLAIFSATFVSSLHL